MAREGSGHWEELNIKLSMVTYARMKLATHVCMLCIMFAPYILQSSEIQTENLVLPQKTNSELLGESSECKNIG